MKNNIGGRKALYMGLFGKSKKDKVSINNVAEIMKNTLGAVLLDVWEADEYRGGHLPGSINLSVQVLADNLESLPEKSTPIYVYCLTGRRSRRAEGILKKAGFTHVTNVGGIASYKGEIEK